MSFKFEIEQTENRARAGKLSINENSIQTPIFMPVGTRGSVKAMFMEDLEEIGYQLILGNTYHLYLRPGVDVLNEFKGLKNFNSWSRALLTDSGGYQAFSLGPLTKYKENGVQFRSHIDGSRHLFTPESVLDIQKTIGSDIVMPLDDCAPYPADQYRLKESLTRTHQWLQQSKDYMKNLPGQNLFGIAQGGIDLNFRKDSAKFVADLDLPGNAIGGLSVGEKKAAFVEALDVACEYLPNEKPRYLMGVGSVPEIIRAVAYGVDMFDCVLPTRNARNGQVFTSTGKVNIRNEKHKNSDRPIDESCDCKVCQRYSIGYIRHLHHVKEILGINLSTYHNLAFMYNFMNKLRMSILDQKFNEFKKQWLELF